MTGNGWVQWQYHAWTAWLYRCCNCVNSSNEMDDSQHTARDIWEVKRKRAQQLTRYKRKSHSNLFFPLLNLLLLTTKTQRLALKLLIRNSQNERLHPQSCFVYDFQIDRADLKLQLFVTKFTNSDIFISRNPWTASANFLTVLEELKLNCVIINSCHHRTPSTLIAVNN